MKKFNLKIGGIKEMLSKEQMKKISGGYCAGGDFNGGCETCRTMGGTLYSCFINDGSDCQNTTRYECLLGGNPNPTQSCRPLC